MTVIDRPAGRVLVVDSDGRALLLHGSDPDRPEESWWFTPGGGLDAGETPAEGAARELFEETGLQVDPAELGSPVWHETISYAFRGQEIRQEQDFFVFRGASRQVRLAGDRHTVTAHRWWSPEEIEASTEQIYPAELPSLIRAVR